MASNSNDQDDLGLVEDKLDPLSGENMQEGDGVAEEEGKDSGVKGVETNESSRCAIVYSQYLYEINK